MFVYFYMSRAVFNKFDTQVHFIIVYIFIYDFMHEIRFVTSIFAWCC